MVKEKYSQNARPLWNIVKGTYGDNGQETIFEAAVREVYEEASVRVRLDKIVALYSILKEYQLKMYTFFLTTLVTGVAQPQSKKFQKSKNEDIREVKWFSKKELRSLKKSEYISNIVYLAVKKWLNSKPLPLDSIE